MMLDTNPSLSPDPSPLSSPAGDESNSQETSCLYLINSSSGFGY